jgi:hypothetical protein
LSEAWQIAALLVVGAVVQQIMGGDRMYPDAHAAQRATRHLLVQHRLEIAAGAAPFGDADAQQAGFAGPPPQLVPDIPAPARFAIVWYTISLSTRGPRNRESVRPLHRPTSA